MEDRAVKLPYYSDCVSWPAPLRVLEHLIDNGREIGPDWFARNVEAAGVDCYWPLTELIAGARRGVYGTRFYRLPGRPVFWLVNSSTEYVFAEPETILGLA